MNSGRLDECGLAPVGQLDRFCLTPRWIPQGTGTGGPGMLRQKQEIMACGFLESLVRERSPAARLAAVRVLLRYRVIQVQVDSYEGLGK